MTHIPLKDSATLPQDSQTIGLEVKIGSKFDLDLTRVAGGRIFQWNMCQKM